MNVLPPLRICVCETHQRNHPLPEDVSHSRLTLRICSLRLALAVLNVSVQQRNLDTNRDREQEIEMADSMDELVERLAAQEVERLVKERVAERVKELLAAQSDPKKRTGPIAAPRKARGRVAKAVDTAHAECPRCGKVAKGEDKVERDFGFKVVHLVSGDIEQPQSHCRTCRKKPLHLAK